MKQPVRIIEKIKKTEISKKLYFYHEIETFYTIVPQQQKSIFFVFQGLTWPTQK